MTTFLIVNADDFALTDGVSSGILKACRHGVVTVTTVLMTAEKASEHIARTLQLPDRPGLGVHLNLTYGKPLSEPRSVSTLVDPRGRFTSLDWKLAHSHDLDPDQVRREWRRQINLFVETGATLDHLDCHHFSAVISPEIWEIYLELAAGYGCGLRPLPVAGNDLAPAFFRDGGARQSPGDLNHRFAECGIPTPDRFVSSFYGGSASLDHLLEIIEDLPRGTVELMVHPGFYDDELISVSGYTHERQRELDVLIDPVVRQAIAERGVQLVDYRRAGLT